MTSESLVAGTDQQMASTRDVDDILAELLAGDEVGLLTVLESVSTPCSLPAFVHDPASASTSIQVISYPAHLVTTDMPDNGSLKFLL